MQLLDSALIAAHHQAMNLENGRMQQFKAAVNGIVLLCAQLTGHTGTRTVDNAHNCSQSQLLFFVASLSKAN